MKLCLYYEAKVSYLRYECTFLYPSCSIQTINVTLRGFVPHVIPVYLSLAIVGNGCG